MHKLCDSPNFPQILPLVTSNIISPTPNILFPFLATSTMVDLFKLKICWLHVGGYIILNVQEKYGKLLCPKTAPKKNLKNTLAAN